MVADTRPLKPVVCGPKDDARYRVIPDAQTPCEEIHCHGCSNGCQKQVKTHGNKTYAEDLEECRQTIEGAGAHHFKEVARKDLAVNDPHRSRSMGTLVRLREEYTHVWKQVQRRENSKRQITDRKSTRLNS